MPEARAIVYPMYKKHLCYSGIRNYLDTSGGCGLKPHIPGGVHIFSDWTINAACCIEMWRCGYRRKGPNLPGKYVNQREAPKPNDLSDSRQAGRNECQKLKICTVGLTNRYTKVEIHTSKETSHPSNRRSTPVWGIFSISAKQAS